MRVRSGDFCPELVESCEGAHAGELLANGDDLAMCRMIAEELDFRQRRGAAMGGNAIQMGTTSTGAQGIAT